MIVGSVRAAGRPSGASMMGARMGAMYRLKAYFGMVPAEEMGEYTDEPVQDRLRRRRFADGRRSSRSSREYTDDRWDDRLHLRGRASARPLRRRLGPAYATSGGRGPRPPPASVRAVLGARRSGAPWPGCARDRSGAVHAPRTRTARACHARRARAARPCRPWGRRAGPDHHLAPAQLQGGSHDRRALPRRGPGDHEPHRAGRPRRPSGSSTSPPGSSSRCAAASTRSRTGSSYSHLPTSRCPPTTPRRNCLYAADSTERGIFRQD